MIVSTDTQQADYNVIATMTYRANGVVTPNCLTQYTDLMSQYYGQINTILSQRCSAVNVNMNVSFITATPALLEDNVVKVSCLSYSRVYQFFYFLNTPITLYLNNEYKLIWTVDYAHKFPGRKQKNSQFSKINLFLLASTRPYET